MFLCNDFVEVSFKLGLKSSTQLSVHCLKSLLNTFNCNKYIGYLSDLEGAASSSFDMLGTKWKSILRSVFPLYFVLVDVFVFGGLIDAIMTFFCSLT